MPTILLLALVLAAVFAGYRYLSGRRTRAGLLAAPLTERQRAIIAEHVPLTRKLPQELRHKFEGKVNAFLDQIEFYGCNGLEVTDEMRLSIAAQACLLVTNIDDWYDGLSTILVYPGAFKSMMRQQDGYVVTERETIRLGESWQHGPVVLSWPHSDDGGRNDDDGRNVVFHEFAHQLDGLTGHTDGVPMLRRGQSPEKWRKVFIAAFQAHLDAVEYGRRTLVDPYGADSYEEFFAVTVELFFERPEALAAEAPEVYEQLSILLQVDPRNWV